MIKKDKNEFAVGSLGSGVRSPKFERLNLSINRHPIAIGCEALACVGRGNLSFSKRPCPEFSKGPKSFKPMGFTFRLKPFALYLNRFWSFGSKTLNLKPFALYLSLVFLLSALSSFAQIYPVQVTPVLVPPYSLNTSDYYNGTTERLAVVLTNTDLQKPVLSVRLRMYIEGQNAKLQSKDGVYYPTITLDAGIPQRISLGDLAPYFNVDNLNFSGITRSIYAQNGKLPEGFYSFCFEAIEVNTGQVLSRKSCSMAYITLSDPPLLNLPVKGESIASRDVQNIVFQWTPRNLGSPNGAFNTEYEFTLKEIWDTGIAPEAAFQSTQPLYQVTVRPTTLLMGPAEPQLIPGKRYAWRVRAVSTSPTGEQMDSYRNNGFSEIYWFTYQSDCRPPLAINSSVTSGRATISWTPDPTNNGAPAGGYTLQYRERSLSGSKWYSVNTLENRAVLYDLKPGTTYEYRVGSSCVAGNIGIGTDQTTYSDILTLEINGNPNDSSTVNCGMISPEIAIANRTPIQALNQGDLIMAGSFPVKLTKVSGGGTFSGEGYVTIPMLGQANVKVRFSGIQVNTERQLFAGVIETTYDPNEKQVANLDKVIEGGYGTGIVVTGTDAAEHEVDFPIKGVDNIKPVLKDKDGNVIPEGSTTPAVSATITVDDGNGKKTTIEADKIPTTIKDSEGTVYKVEQGADGKPKVTKVSENVPLKMSPAELNTLAANKGIVTFEAHPKQVYAFDQYQNEYAKSKVFSEVYQKLGNSYFVSAKAILPGKTDLVKAIVKLNDDKLNADSIQFITGKGSKLQATKLQDGSYEVTVVGGPANDAQELYAVYPQGSGKFLTLGKLFIASYQPQTVKVALVPVNGTTLDKNEITDQLNKTYNPIGVSFVVREANNFVNSDWDLVKDGKLAVSGSGFFATQTAEMKALINAYKSASPSLAKDEAVLFMLNSSDSTASLAGDIPRGKQFGYLFSGADGNTAAHEIGHGVFKLEHTFKKYGFTGGDLTGNMMNYPAGAGLTKFQWDAIHAPGIVIGVFEGDEDAMLAGGFGVTPDFTLISTNTNQIVSDATPTADPFVGGFVSINNENKKEYYYWIEKNRRYETKQDKPYVAPNFKPTGESVIWLLVNNNEDCNERKYIRTLYKEVEALINKKNTGGLQDYIKRYLNQTDQSKPVYAGKLGCGETGNGTSGSGITPNAATFFANNKQGGAVDESGNVVDYSRRFTKEDIEAMLGKINTTSSSTGIQGKIFITDEFTEKADRDKVTARFNNPQTKEMVIWLDITDTKAKQFDIKINAGSGLPQFKDKSTEELLAILRKNSFWFEDIWGNFNPLTAMLDGIAELIAKAKIPERFYNPDLTDYNPLPSKIYGYVTGQFISQAVERAIFPDNPYTEKYSKIRCEFALLCGAWNGAITLVGGIPEGASFLIKVILNEDGLRTQLGDSWDKLSWEQVQQMAGNEWKKYTANPCMISYGTGEVVFFVASCFIGAGEVGAVTKTFNIIEKLDVMGQLMGRAFKITGKLIKPVARAGGKFIKYIVEAGGVFIRELKIVKLPTNKLYCTLIPRLPYGVNVTEAAKAAYNKLKNKARLQEALNDATFLTDDAGKHILDENGNYLAEVIVDGEKIPVIIGEEEALKKIDNEVVELGREASKTIDNVIANIRNNYAKWGLNSVDEVEEIINTLKNNLPDDADNILTTLDNLVDNGTTFGKIKQTINEIAKYKQFGDGSKWTLKYLTDNIDVFKGKNILFESTEEIYDETFKKQMRYIDVKIINGGVGKDIFYEFKSVISVPPAKFAQQFIKDLSHSEVTNLRQLKWIFDSSKNPANFADSMSKAIMNLPDDKLNILANKFGTSDAKALKEKIIDNFDKIFIK